MSNVQLDVERRNVGYNRRITETLLRYWLQLRRGRYFPSEQDVNPEDIGSLWDNCFLVHISSKPTENQDYYKYTYLGGNLIHVYDGDITEEGVCKSLVSPFTKKVSEKFDEVFETKRPVYDESEFTNSNNIIIKYRQILLPLGDNDDNVNYILGGMKWKSF